VQWGAVQWRGVEWGAVQWSAVQWDAGSALVRVACIVEFGTPFGIAWGDSDGHVGAEWGGSVGVGDESSVAFVCVWDGAAAAVADGPVDE
jgi:hypothetical protein